MGVSSFGFLSFRIFVSNFFSFNYENWKLNLKNEKKYKAEVK